MIVKNESKIIKKCLNSIADYLDYWVISDTGSTDGTQDIIKSFFKEKGIPGELHEDKWVNFGYNRTLYLKYAKNKADFLIILDADFIVNIKDKNFKNKLTNTNVGYQLQYEENMCYRQVLMVSGNISWKYVGVTHENITTDENYKVENNDDIMINHIGNGNNKKDKFTRDIKLLSQGIKDEPNNSRYYFYLAQSYKCCEDYKNAIKYYKKRVEMKGWVEEVYYSLYMIGICKQRDGLDFENEILYDYLKAYNYKKNRLEALYEIVNYYRRNNRYREGYSYGMLGMKNSYPKDILFIDREIHTYKFIDELAICAYWVGDHKLAIELNTKLLNLECLSDHYKIRIKKNLSFSLNVNKSKTESVKSNVSSLNVNKSKTESVKRNVFLYWIGKEYKLVSILRNIIYLHSTNGIGYNVILITHENIHDYIDNIPNYFYDLCPAHQADFVRVNVICDYGGIWIDSDTLVLDSLDSLFDIIEKKDGFLIKENNNILWNGIFGSKKGTNFMKEWKNRMHIKLEITKGKIGWNHIGCAMLDDMYKINPSLFENYKIFLGLDNLYPCNWNNCVTEFITKPYDNYKNIIRNYQPLIVFVNSVYKALENNTINEILNGNMPINYFINKSFQNIGISKTN
tara:strand:+ start:127 stop:2007 length:1881 start_codon:yes stop_codon:yes gene_type:complete